MKLFFKVEASKKSRERVISSNAKNLKSLSHAKQQSNQPRKAIESLSHAEQWQGLAIPSLAAQDLLGGLVAKRYSVRFFWDRLAKKRYPVLLLRSAIGTKREGA